MGVLAGGGSGGLSLGDFTALNDEIAALVRAGLPLDRALAGVGRGRLGEVARRIAARLERGEGLEAALRAEEPGVPPLYAAVVRAGMRSGRLPAALEGLAGLARSYADLRHTLGMALLYPVLVLALAYALFVGFVLYVLPSFLAIFADLGVPVGGVLRALEWLGAHAAYWVPAFPVLLLAAILAWWRSGRAGALPGAGGRTLLGLVPGVGGLLRQVNAAGYADLLALLIEHGTPMPEALALAGEATGDPALARASGVLAAAVAGGASGTPATVTDARRELAAIPPTLRWLILRPDGGEDRAAALRHAASAYRRRAAVRADLVRTFLPTLALLAVGATATLVYTLTLFVPFTTLLRQLTGEIR
jgi:general secretion pathway protein F